jgi:hypothetical protein
MRKLFAVIGLLASLFFLNPVSISAQTGTFACTWDNTAPLTYRCHPANMNCISPYVADLSYCSNYNTDQAGCLAQTSISCVANQGGAANVASPDKCGPNGNGLKTAIGCINIFSSASNPDFGPFATFLIKWGIGIGGGIAFILIVYAGFIVTTSAGNPQRMAAGKELLTAAVMGLLMLAFAAFILRFIGRDILGLDKIGL